MADSDHTLDGGVPADDRDVADHVAGDPLVDQPVASVEPSDDATSAGARRASTSSRWFVRRRGDVPVGGERIRAPYRRAKGLPGTLGVTVLAALVPGAGLLYTRRWWRGAIVLVAWLALLGGLAWHFGRRLKTVLDFAFDTTEVRVAAVLIAVGLVVWALLLLGSYRLARPRVRSRAHTIVGNLAVLVLILAVGSPFAVGVRYAWVTADTIDKVLPANPISATAPQNVTTADPWGGRKRVNVLLLGGDGGADRTGVRTDSMILASMDTTTGKTVLFSLPRNMMYAEFPKKSPLHQIYPDGYGRGGTEDPSFYMLNAIYGQVPEDYPHILGKSDNEGADALKEAISGTLGLHVDYYMLVDFDGFRDVVNAMGGITVNVDEPVAINGQTDAHIPPTGYIEPGPNQHLDGYHALWFARGRYGSDDYQRMDRQRCAIDALVKAAHPTTLLKHYVALAHASQHLVRTDIPRKLGSAFADLLLKTKDASVRSVVFRRSDQFDPADPDFTYMHQVVKKALHPPKKHGKKHHEVQVENPTDVCAYHPVTGYGTTDDVTSSGTTASTTSTTP